MAERSLASAGLCVSILIIQIHFYMAVLIGLLIGSGVLVAFFAFLLKKLFTFSKTISSWGEANRSAIAYSFVPVLSLFIHPAGPSGSVTFFFMAIVLFSVERYRAGKKNSLGSKGSQG